MPQWTYDLLWLLGAANGLWALASLIWDRQIKHHDEVLLELGPPPPMTPQRILSLVLSVCSLAVFVEMIRREPPLRATSMAVFIASMGVVGWSRSMEPTRLTERGMFVHTRFLSTKLTKFISWDEIQSYAWNGEDLVINSGWRQATCVIPAELADAVTEILRAKCTLSGGSASSSP